MTRYVYTANELAAFLRFELPDVGGPKLHRLLYYVQGHRLAYSGRPAFTEAIVAGPDGPEVAGFDDDHREHVRGVLDDEVLSIAYMEVVGRYGRLSTADLNRLSMAETPWRDASPGAVIGHDALAAFFAGDGAREQPEGIPAPTEDELVQLRANARRLRDLAR